jgi:hypothetical protein
VSVEGTYTNAEKKNWLFSGLKHHQAQFGLNPALNTGKMIEQITEK